MKNGVIITTPKELQTLIQDAVNVAVQQFSLPLKVDPLPLRDYLSIEQTCRFLNLAKPTLYAYTSKKQIPYIKKGKQLYFVKSELEKWLEEGSIKTSKILTNKKNK
ncbi:helix-turn-helix domain-containing protein [Emticicia fluvialis]|uniref:helix-turn-helix domain-containing protein n=1 Tax=Emticicia fluvialis TaxID=2974474 RepID=UPI002166A0D9|nr:helix-turn-helix domain-containing protein [Emticicia fluvialis]